MVVGALVLASLPLLAGAIGEVGTVPRTAMIVEGDGMRVGRLIPNMGVQAFDGTSHDLHALLGETATVFVMTDLTCPLSGKWRPEVARIASSWRDQGVRFVFVNPTAMDTAEQMEAEFKRLGIHGVAIDDRDRTLTATLGATSTTDVLLLDSAGTLRYRGAVNDQYGLGHAKQEATVHYLNDAIAAVVENRTPSVDATLAPGCVIDLTGAKAVEPELTYHGRISRIVADSCVSCHSEGGVGPFALDTYEAVARRAAMIGFVVDEGIMPPWPAAPLPAGHVGFSNNRALPEADKAAIREWIDAGKPQGDPGNAPLPREQGLAAASWAIGEPDAIFSLPEPQQVNAEGQMSYRYIRVPANFDSDRWVKAIQVKPTAPEVVHHVLVFAVPPEDLDGSDEARYRLRQRFRENAGYFAAYVPGNDHVIFRDGFAKKIEAGSEIIFQIHYTPNGKATVDQCSVGIVFADEPPAREVRVHGIADTRLNIPAGEARHEESTSLPITRDIHLLAVMPHMHLRGSSFRYELTTPDGKTTTLLDVPRWDFNWQLAYRFNEPLAVPQGSRIDVFATYDNSPENPANPDPTAQVGWGDQTDDEMLIGYIEYYRDDEAVGVE